MRIESATVSCTTVMSSSNTTGRMKTQYPRYRNRLCGCKLRAAVRISESDRNPGRLYYGCPKDSTDKERCSFWEWCILIGYEEPNPDLAAERDDRVLEVNLGRNDARVQVLEVNVSNLKYVVYGTFFLSGLALLIAVIALVNSM